MIARDGGDALAVDARIVSASKAFGAHRGCKFSSSTVSPAAKRVVYESLVLSIALYGCECWCLNEQLLDRLRVFHAQCLRAMCAVSHGCTHGAATSVRRSSGSGWVST